MLNDFVFNEIFMSAEYIENHKLNFPDKSTVNIIGGHIFCEYLKNTIEYLNRTTNRNITLNCIKSSSLLSNKKEGQIFLFLFDARNKNTQQLSDFKQALDFAKNIRHADFTAIVIIPELIPRDDIHSLSEMELSYITASSYLNDVERLLKDYCDKMTVKEIRFDNIFGAKITDDGKMNVSKTADKICSDLTIEISSSEALDTFTAISVTDAINAVFTVLSKGKHANIYNASGYSYTSFEIKSFLYNKLCKYGVKLILNKNENDMQNEQIKRYTGINSGKLSALGFSYVCNKEIQLLYAFMPVLSQSFDLLKDRINNLYDGKIDKVREIELNILAQLDAICRENDINYFLSGGSMLGAVRHGGFIPWDDDVDVAMLREDFEKFKIVCKDKFGDRFCYQTFENKNGYHYFFDKITDKNTYFSTKYSDSFDMLKGISLDIFVFDKTSNNKLMQKIHFKKLMALRLIMNVRWINHPRRGKSYLLSKLLLPILRIFSMDTYSKWYDKLLRKYEHKKTDYVLPPSTDHKNRGVMPIKWFQALVPAKFESIDSFIPVGYNDYLKIWYGKDYMNLLPICKRMGSHDFYRLDLGSEIDGGSNFSSNYKGELL